MTDEKKDKIDKEIDELLKSAGPASSKDAEDPNGPQEAGINIKGDRNLINVGGKMVIDRRKTIINQHRRGIDTIDEDQQRDIKRKLYAIVELDSFNPHGEGNNFNERQSIARRKRWQALGREFHVRSYKHITSSQFKAAMAWLQAQHDIELDKINPDRPGFTGSAKMLTLILLIGVALAAWPIIQTLLPNPPQAQAASYYKVPHDPGRPTIIPATATEPETTIDLLFFTGCAHIKTKRTSVNNALSTI